MLLDSESLRCFETVATLLNFRAASRSLALSPTALSERIQRLETQIGARLFERSTRHVALTPEGERLLPEARHVLEALARAQESIHGEGTPGPSELWIGTRYELGLSWLIPALPQWKALWPERTFHFHFGDTPELLARMREGRLDAIVSSSKITEGRWESRDLHAESYVLVGERRWIAQHPFRGAKDAAAHALIDLRPDLPLSRYFLDQAGGPSLWPFARVESLGTIAAVRLRLLQGGSIAVLPSYFVAKELTQGRLVNLLPRLRLPEDQFRLLWPRGHRATLHLEALAELLMQRPLR